MKLCKCNKVLFGLVLGLVMPVLTSLLLYSFAYHGSLDFAGFLKGLMQTDNLSRLMAVCALPNLILFLIAINLDKLLAARGIVTATLVIGIFVVIFKFIV
jgi:hypothetical protein